MIEINNLNINYGKHPAISDLSLVIPDNCFISIVGPNGAGKTTLIHSLAGILPVKNNEILIDGKKPTEIPAKNIGFVPQIKTFDLEFPSLAYELVATGITATWPSFIKKKIKVQALQALEEVGCLHLAEKSLNQLSGGELQRVCLARALIRKPKYLLLDEPIAGIDLVAESDIHTLLDNYIKNEKATIIMVTHDWESAYHHSDFVILLNQKLICYDKPNKVFTEDNLRKAFGHIGHHHKMIFRVNNDD